MQHVVYVYGTLRTGTAELHKIPGRLYDLGHYPGAILEAPGSSFFMAERHVVDDAGLRRLDSYEGYREDQPAWSLFLRVPYLDGSIYTYNNAVATRPVIEGGDYLKYKNVKTGSANSLMISASVPETRQAMATRPYNEDGEEAA